MVHLARSEPQLASDYDHRMTAAVKSVLIEIGQVLGSFRGKFAVVGGVVPWLLLDNEEMPHVGSMDVDLSLNADALGDGQYATLVQALMMHGYQQRKDSRRFQLVRSVLAGDGGSMIDIVVDFLMPREVRLIKNSPPLIANFAVQKADGVDLAMRFYQFVAIDGSMPDGGANRVEIAVCSIPALLAMKGYALDGRAKQKDAYDIYYCIRNYEGGPEALAAACRPLLGHPTAGRGYAHIAEKFDRPDGYGPDRVRRFVGENPPDGRAPEQWQQDAFGQVDAWLRALGLRK